MIRFYEPADHRCCWWTDTMEDDDSRSVRDGSNDSEDETQDVEVVPEDETESRRNDFASMDRRDYMKAVGAAAAGRHGLGGAASSPAAGATADTSKTLTNASRSIAPATSKWSSRIPTGPPSLGPR